MSAQHRLMMILGVVLGWTLLLAPNPRTDAAEAQWIWASGTTANDAVDVGEVCYFRKSLNLRQRGTAFVEIAADDRYEVFVNGKKVGSGASVDDMVEMEITDFVEPGRNVVAIRVENTKGSTAALVARVSIQPDGSDRWFTFSTDESWRTNTNDLAGWNDALLNDGSWGAATSFGLLGETAPWDRDPSVAISQSAERAERFQIQRGFGVQRILNDGQVGSVIAMAFDEFKHLILSQENGPLLLVVDRDEDGFPETVQTYCDAVESVQGILPLNGEVFVTGDGPEGVALYRLIDHDRDGQLETVKTVLKFRGQGGEHGPHGLTLGPDGMIYVTLGAYVSAVGKKGKGETLRDSYEGDLLPRYEDPGGHGRGTKAPGGTIIRTDIEGKVVERVAGGLRNVYDLAFHPGGGLFVHDSDMEADIGTPWYRPTMLFQIAESGEYGWRTGWAKWPEHYYDRLPSMLDTGRGSPTGIECYEHFMFPVRYQNSLFLADWSEGRILNVKLKQSGSGYVADSEVFLQGQPLNVTDLTVGTDGSLYFCTGGRGTAGGVYRVSYQGKVPESMKQLGTGIAAAVRQPQISAAWGRQVVAGIRREMGDSWGQQIAGVAFSDDNPAEYRVRAMDLMQMFGPAPSEDLLIELSETESEVVRRRAAVQLGLTPSRRGAARLEALLEDSDALVRRAACEAILRSGQLPRDAASVLPLLADDDRSVAYVARSVLQRMPTSSWRKAVMKTDQTRVALVGMLALVNAEPDVDTGIGVLKRCSAMMSDFLSDKDFVDTLRLCQVTLQRCEIPATELTWFRDQIADEFPSGDSRMNQELIRLACYLQAESMVERALEYLESDAPDMDRILTAMCLQHINRTWTARERFALLKFYERMASTDSEGALPMYMVAATRDFSRHLSEDDIQAILDEGARWRNAALGAIFRLERPIDGETAGKLRRLDDQLTEDPKIDDVHRRLRTGIIAMLSTAPDEDSAAHLRQIWRREPERRAVVAMALAQKPDGDNWDYLVRSLNILDGPAASEVVKQLATVQIATDDPMALRSLILMGLRAQENGEEFEPIELLLEHWTGMQRPPRSKSTMEPWQRWFSKVYPDRAPAELPKGDESRWDLDQLLTYLEGPEGSEGDPLEGANLFAAAKCADCHRKGSVGISVGPDLSGLAKRFTRRETLESILYPSHIVSDQYASKKVLTLDGTVFMGMVNETASGIQVRDANNAVTDIPGKDLDQILPSRNSIMPSGLIDTLSMQQISDLMAFLNDVENTTRVASGVVEAVER